MKNKAEMEQFLKEAKICRIALSQKDNPYVVPMIFAYDNNIVYLHSAAEGKKLDIIKQNNRVCFEIDEMNEIVTKEVACLFGLKYRSVIGFGTAQLITKAEEKKAALTKLMEKYSDKNDWEFPPVALEKVAVIKIEFDELTGKKSKK